MIAIAISFGKVQRRKVNHRNTCKLETNDMAKNETCEQVSSHAYI